MTIEVVWDESGIATWTIDQPDRSANVLGPSATDALRNALDRLAERPDTTGVIVTSAKKDFVVGADIDGLFAMRDPAQAAALVTRFKDQLRRLETLGIPVVAALNGSAFGGGYELALACHYRILLDRKGVKLGLPEIKLGLFPGGGGSLRLPRMHGIQKALGMLGEGVEVNPQAALAGAWVEELVEDEHQLIERAKGWIRANPQARQPWDHKGFRFPGGDSRHPAMVQLWALAPAMLRKRRQYHLPAARALLSSVFEGSLVDFDTASRIETRYFSHVATGQVAKNMMTAFWYQLNQIKKGGARPADQSTKPVTRVGILGAGMMGAGIAEVCSLKRLPLVLKDASLAQAEAGKQAIAARLRKRCDRGRLTEDHCEQALAQIFPSGDDADLAGCDLVIEAVFENRELKAQVTRNTEQVMDASGIFASNTSTLPISGLAEASSRPNQFIGLHFFSPVPRMRLVEIIVGKQTSPETLARAFDFVGRIGKIPIVVNDSRGFYTSRVFSTYVKEGLALLAEGQQARSIESAGLAAGMPVGPLALSDEVSLSLMHHIQQQTRKDLAVNGAEPENHPADGVIAKMVDDWDRPGRKAGRGFYDYPANSEKHLWPGLTDHFPVRSPQLEQGEMMDRLMMIQAIETVRCLEEGVIHSVAEANLGSIFGWGFAPSEGGTLQFIRARGVASFVKRARVLADTYGPRFHPPTMLVEAANKGEEPFSG